MSSWKRKSSTTTSTHQATTNSMTASTMQIYRKMSIIFDSYAFIHFAGDSTMIQCDLPDDLSLEEYTKRFTTISYCAGDPKQTESVTVDGLCFIAFANLGHALRQARHFWKKTYGDRELLLWADQICINQSNGLERSHQVNFMGEIYAAAEQVLACSSTDASQPGGLEWLRQMAAHEDKRRKDRTKAHYLEYSGTNEGSHRAWAIFIDTVFSSPWWSRAWVRTTCDIHIYTYLLILEQ
jgi:hypothetical protein